VRTDFIRCQKGNHGGGIWCQSNEVVLEDVLFQECDLLSPFGGTGFAFRAEYCLATVNRVRVTDTDEKATA